MALDPVVREYLDAHFQLSTPEDWAKRKWDEFSSSVGRFYNNGNYQYFARIGPQTVQLLNYKSARQDEYELVPDESKDPKEVYAMLLRAAVDWKHGEALRMLEKEKQTERAIRTNLENVGTNGLRSSIPNRYPREDDVDALEDAIECIEGRFDRMPEHV
jgi:hypothetical protein